MAQYIDKAVIVMVIEKLIAKYKEISVGVDKKGNDWVDSVSMLNAKIDTLQSLLSIISSLEVKEVDLEKEVRNFLNDNYTSVEEPDEFLTTKMQIDDMTKFAEHFYALGLNGNQVNLNAQDLIEKYVSDHADCCWLDASELEQLLNDFVLEYDVIKNREYEQQCKVSKDGRQNS